jgi:hypothetical protein
MTETNFNLGDKVRIIASGETGVVKGLAIYDIGPPAAYIHYKAADGRATSCWWSEDLLEPA